MTLTTGSRALLRNNPNGSTLVAIGLPSGKEGVEVEVTRVGRDRGDWTVREVNGGRTTWYVSREHLEPVPAAGSDETITAGGYSFTVGEIVTGNGSGSEYEVISQSDPRIAAAGLRDHQDGYLNFLRISDSRVRRVYAANLSKTGRMTAAARQRTSRWTADQERQIIRAVSAAAEAHGACAVASQALEALGLSQTQATETVTINLQLKVPISNGTGQVQLPRSIPSDYFASHVSTATLNSLVDAMAADARGVRRQGDATIVVTGLDRES